MTHPQIGDRFRFTTNRPWSGKGISGTEKQEAICRVTYVDQYRIEYAVDELLMIDNPPPENFQPWTCGGISMHGIDGIWFEPRS